VHVAKVVEERGKNNGDVALMRVVNVNQGSGGLVVVSSPKFCKDLGGSGGKREWVEKARGTVGVTRWLKIAM
jgi:hypothetical protein